jgi:hypothetical protein
MIEYRAIIPEKGYKGEFTLFELLDEPKFSLRQLVIPWILSGNLPDRFSGIMSNDLVKVYEGDVVRSWDGLLSVVKCGSYNTKNILGFNGWYLDRILKNPDNNYCSCDIEHFQSMEFKDLVGNIIENPELLKVGKMKQFNRKEEMG